MLESPAPVPYAEPMPTRPTPPLTPPAPRSDRLESDAVTHGVRVHVVPAFVPEESDPHQRRFIFSYRIRITNEGSAPVKLLSRRWLIIDAHGRQDAVEGGGVVGKQPRLMPGETFEYASFCPLTTPWGTMEGSYQMTREDGEKLDVKIARFFLAMPAKVAATPHG